MKKVVILVTLLLKVQKYQKSVQVKIQTVIVQKKNYENKYINK